MSMLSQQMFLSALVVNSPANASLKAGSLPEWKKRPGNSGLFVCLAGRLLVFFVQLELAGHLLLHIGRNRRIACELDGVAALAAGQ